MGNFHLDHQIAALALRQYGHVTREQLIGLGLTAAAIEHRIKVGRLIIVHRGVYAVGHRHMDPYAAAKAAELAGGRDAAASHSSAAFLWGIAKRLWALPEITIPRDRRLSTLRVHVSRTLTRRDITTHHGIRVTSPARTLLDNASRYSDRQLARAVNDLRHDRHLSLDDLAELLHRLPRAPAAGRLLPFVQSDPGITRSMFEDAFLDFVRHFELPTPQLNVYVAGYLVDAFFPEQRLIVELDSWEFHKDRQSFEGDRERDAATLTAGCATVRITWPRLTARSQREGDRLRLILAQRASRDGAS
jgi:very-short-patch-repair endonuclease